jgi:NADPH2 dehydrogenase
MLVGDCQLQHRVVLAPLTRFRSSDSHVPLPMVTEYYVQRASTPGTLLISEATLIAPEAGGYDNAPGIWNKDQIDSWREVTDAVHAKGSFIFLQLWAMGRAAIVFALKRELGQQAEVVSSSNIAFPKGSKPRPMTEWEIDDYVELYVQAARNSIDAGFDGVEIHCGNGYLLDQFQQDTCNKRTDKYGGSIENRARFPLMVARSVVEAIGAKKTAVRISPFSDYQGMKMDNPIPQFTYFVKHLKELELAYLHIVEARMAADKETKSRDSIDFLIDLWDNQSPVILAGGFKSATARECVDDEYSDRDIGIAFGRYFISNPDLVFRLQKGIPLALYNRATFYSLKEEEGYTDYPFHQKYLNSR